MVAAPADKGEKRAVGGPSRAAGVSAHAKGDGRLGVASQWREPDLVLEHERDAIPLGRDPRRVTIRELAGSSARDRDEIHSLLDPLRPARGIRKLPFAVGVAAPGEDEILAVGRELEIADLLPIVLRICRQGAPAVTGGFRDPDIAHSLRVEDPRHGAARPGSDEVRRKRGRQDLFQREIPASRRDGRGASAGQDQQSENPATSHRPSCESFELYRGTTIASSAGPYAASLAGPMPGTSASASRFAGRAHASASSVES